MERIYEENENTSDGYSCGRNGFHRVINSVKQKLPITVEKDRFEKRFWGNGREFTTGGLLAPLRLITSSADHHWRKWRPSAQKYWWYPGESWWSWKRWITMRSVRANNCVPCRLTNSLHFITSTIRLTPENYFISAPFLIKPSCQILIISKHKLYQLVKAKSSLRHGYVWTPNDPHVRWWR